MVTIKKSIGWRSGWCGGEEKGEKAAASWAFCWGQFLSGCMEKRETASKSGPLWDASQGWTLKGVFLFFPFRLGRSPKELCLSSFFLGPALLPSLASAGKNLFPPEKSEIGKYRVRLFSYHVRKVGHTSKRTSIKLLTVL